MNGLDGALKASLLLLAVCASIAALVGAWSMTTRTTPINGGWGVARENLVTGQLTFCDPNQCRTAPAAGASQPPA